MRIAAVGERESIIGIRLAGVKTVLETSNPKEALEYVKKLLEENDIAIIIITSAIIEQIQSELETLRRGRMTPAFITFPDVNIAKR